MSKKLALALGLALLLCGCAQEPAPTDSAPAVDASAATESTLCFYVPDSAVELGTGGAVRQFRMDEPLTGLSKMGDDLLVCDENQTLSLLSGEDLSVLRQRKVESPISWDQICLAVSPQGMAYYDADASAYVVLDSNLVTTAVVDFQEELLTEPIITPDFSAIYYAADSGIRVMDVNNGTSRLIREESGTVLTMDALLFEGGVLCYTRTDSAGNPQTCFVDTENGSLLHAGDFRGQLVSSGSAVAGIMELEQPLGTCKWIITGDREGNLQMLQPRSGWSSHIFPGGNLVVLQQERPLGLMLYCYDLSTGALLSRVTLPEWSDPFAYGTTDGSKLWLWDGTSGEFFCWDTQLSGAGDSASCLTDYVSLAQPDDAGMAKCQAQAELLAEQYGVRITLEADTSRTEGVDYGSYPDYRPELYREALNMLEQALEKFPDGFLLKLGKATKAGKIEIRLVDDFDPAQPIPQGTGSVELEGGAQAALVSMCENIEQILYHELFHLMDTQINNKGDSLKDWEALNPEGFAYSGAVAAYDAGELSDSPWLEPGENCVADARSLISPREDRAQLFLYAMLEGEAARFDSPIMQTKLATLCQAVRSTYDLEEGAVLPWEQYLKAVEE